ncbi:MAG: transcriptional activator RfaH [Proteobacteria bacterium]|nr:transcriptional activator RfaH [Pseudomonadota bacterium]
MAIEVIEFHRGRWAVAMTHLGKEHIALEHLARQGFETYCPRIAKRVRHGRRYVDKLHPLFPGYLFVEVPLHRAQWRPILSTYGIKTIIRFGGEPAMLGDEFIEALKSRESDGAITCPAAPYRVGQQIRMTGGAFDGVVATILSVNSSARLVVLMDLLKRGVRTSVSTKNVLPAVGDLAP